MLICGDLRFSGRPSRNTAPASPAPNIGLSGTKKDRIDVFRNFSQLMHVMQALAA